MINYVQIHDIILYKKESLHISDHNSGLCVLLTEPEPWMQDQLIKYPLLTLTRLIAIGRFPAKSVQS